MQLDTKTSLDIVLFVISALCRMLQLDTKTSLDIVEPRISGDG